MVKIVNLPAFWGSLIYMGERLSSIYRGGEGPSGGRPPSLEVLVTNVRLKPPCVPPGQSEWRLECAMSGLDAAQRRSGGVSALGLAAPRQTRRMRAAG